MKKLIMICAFMSLLVELPGQDKMSDMELLVPGEAILFGKTSKISDVILSVKYVIDTYADDTEKEDLSKGRSEILAATGIDILDPASLEKGGIDTSRPAGLAYFSKKKESEDLIVIIPVHSTDRFPLKFAELVKKLNKDSANADLNPVVTPYKNNSIHQIGKDIFATAMGGYFFVAPAGDLIKKVIDLSANPAGSLMRDSAYSGYLGSKKEIYDLDIFARGDMIAEAMDSSADRGDADGKGEKGGKDKEQSYAKSVQYIGGGLTVRKGKVRIKISSNLNPGHPIAEMASGILKTGVAGRSLTLARPLFYLFVSYNHQYLNNMCAKPGPPSSFCSFYKSSIKKVETDFGIDFMKDFLPPFTGAVTTTVRKIDPRTGKGDFLVYFAMNNEAKTASLWGKMREGTRKKYLKTQSFGEGKAGVSRVFWFTEGGEKIHFLADKRGLYVSNSLDLLKVSLNSRETASADPSDRFKQKLTADSFFFLNVNNDPSLTGMVKSQTAGNPGVSRAADSITDFSVRITRENNYISLDLDISIKEPKKEPKKTR